MTDARADADAPDADAPDADVPDAASGPPPRRTDARVEYVVRRGEDLAADVDDLIVVYSAATAPNDQDVRARRELMVSHAEELDAAGVLALADGALVGFAYGTTSRPGDWWHDHVDAALPATDRERWLRDAYVIREVAVQPRHQQAGIGTELVRRLVTLPDAERHRTILLGVDMDTLADSLFRRLGFEDVVEGLPFAADGRTYRIMGRGRP